MAPKTFAARLAAPEQIEAAQHEAAYACMLPTTPR